MTYRVAILKDVFIPVYRLKTFKLLNEKSEINYVIIHGNPPSSVGHISYEKCQQEIDFPNIKVKNLEFTLGKRTLLYQPAIREILTGNYDAVVVGHEISIVSNLIIFLLRKIVSKPVIWWGHGFEKDKLGDTSPKSLKLLAKIFKARLARSADLYMAYTEGGAQKLQQIGMPAEKICVINNTLDIEHESLLHAKYQVHPLNEVKRELGLNANSLFLLYIGRIYKEKRVDDFCNLIVRLNQTSKSSITIEGLILGDGPELSYLKENHNNTLLHYLGPVYEPEKIAQYMRVSTALVMPGKVGLAVNHAFAHGLPVITRDSNLHAPEVEYIQHDMNGLILPEDFDEFVYSISNFLSSPEKVQFLSENALKKSRDLNLDSMVGKFDSAVKSVILSQ